MSLHGHQLGHKQIYSSILAGGWQVCPGWAAGQRILVCHPPEQENDSDPRSAYVGTDRQTVLQLWLHACPHSWGTHAARDGWPAPAGDEAQRALHSWLWSFLCLLSLQLLLILSAALSLSKWVVCMIGLFRQFNCTVMGNHLANQSVSLPHSKMLF